MLVSQWNVDDTMDNEDVQGVINGHLLSASGSASRNEDPSVFTSESTGCPQFAGRVPECLPLGREISVSSRDTEQESVVGGEDICSDDWVVGLGRGVHQRKDIFRESFGNPEGRREHLPERRTDVDSDSLVDCRTSARRFNTGLGGFGNWWGEKQTIVSRLVTSIGERKKIIEAQYSRLAMWPYMV